jgi:hypothetical protein
MAHAGWILQELIAPASVEFFSKDWDYLGNKAFLERQICEITGILVKAHQGISLFEFSLDERLSWAANRQTTREEDIMYSLLGIFGVYIPLIYGEERRMLSDGTYESSVKPSPLPLQMGWSLISDGTYYLGSIRLSISTRSSA